METTTTSQFTNDIAPLPERPQFLKVLCILTWVLCGLTVLQIIAGMALKSGQPAKVEVATTTEQSISPNTVKFEVSQGEQMFNAVLNLVAVAFSAFGAWWMWRLKSKGFYIYLIGEILPYIAFLGVGNTLAAMSGAFGSMGDAFVGAFIGIMVVFDLAFIIMYAVNLKYMNK